MDRKEAIEIVRKNYPHVGFSGSEFETALRELVPEFKEQPDPRHSLIEFIKWSCDRGSITPEQRKNVDFWLAYLERQKDKVVKIDHDREQKPAEWSEEDERITAKLLSYFNEFDESTSFGSREVIEIRHWLKSLRPQPHWKPSEEQMQALWEVVQALWEVESRMRTNKAFTLSNRLAFLYNDLQKLL